MLVGMAISISGSLLIFWSDSQQQRAGKQSLLGNFLALVGSWCFSAYLLIGRRLRAGHAAAGLHVWLAYGVASLFLLLACGGAAWTLTGYDAAGLSGRAGMALGPQLLGHTSYNWSLRTSRRPSSPSSRWANRSAARCWPGSFRRVIRVAAGVGFVLLLLGIYLAARAEGR
jgi:drug/metabolite transporter (DMT)-like permease